MNQRAFFQRRGFTFSATVTVVLLLAVLLLASSTQYANGYPGGLADTPAPSSAYPLLESADSTSADWPQARVEAALRSTSVMFIENVGQFDDRARFQVHGGTGTMWLTDDAIWITVIERSHVGLVRRFNLERTNVQLASVERENEPLRGVNLKLTFPGAKGHGNK